MGGIPLNFPFDGSETIFQVDIQPLISFAVNIIALETSSVTITLSPNGVEMAFGGLLSRGMMLRGGFWEGGIYLRFQFQLSVIRAPQPAGAS